MILFPGRSTGGAQRLGGGRHVELWGGVGLWWGARDHRAEPQTTWRQRQEEQSHHPGPGAAVDQWDTVHSVHMEFPSLWGDVDTVILNWLHGQRSIKHKSSCVETDLFHRNGNNSECYFEWIEVIAAEVPLEPERILIYLIQSSEDHVTSFYTWGVQV